MRRPSEQLRLAAAGQDSQFATAQALELGMTRRQLEGMCKRGEIERLRRGVSRFASAAGESDPAVTAMLACWPDGVISHASAAVHHGIRRISVPAEPEVTVPHGVVRKLPGIRVHWSRSLDNEDRIRVGNVSYTTVARTTCDLSDPEDPWETLALVDDVVAMGTNRRWLFRRAKALANGRRGVTLVREATAPDASRVFNSWLERSAAHIYRAGGLPDPEWNVRVHDASGLIGIVDALWPQWRVVSEKEGLRFHTTPSQRRRDASRFNRLQDADYRVRRFTWEDIVHRPLEVVATLYRALEAAGADLDRARIPRAIVLPSRPFVL